MNTAGRLLLAATCVAVIHGGARWAREGTLPRETRPIEQDLHRLPTAWGPWQGSDEKLDPELFRATSAEVCVNRIYRTPAGEEVCLSAAVWSGHPSLLPHHPRICYEARGYRLSQAKDVLLPLAEQPGIQVELLTFRREGKRIAVLYWYQFGEHLLFNHDDLRKARWTFRGKMAWPPIVKIMLQTAASDPVKAENLLRDIGPRVYTWTRDFR